MYDISDNDSKKYIEEISEKFSPYIPRILVHDKMGGAARVGGLLQSGIDTVNMLQTFAKSIDIKVCQELTDARVKDLVELILSIAVEPFRGISEKGIEGIKEMRDK